jgi:hypothetical protein
VVRARSIGHRRAGDTSGEKAIVGVVTFSFQAGRYARGPVFVTSRLGTLTIDRLRLGIERNWEDTARRRRHRRGTDALGRR